MKKLLMTIGFLMFVVLGMAQTLAGGAETYMESGGKSLLSDEEQRYDFIYLDYVDYLKFYDGVRYKLKTKTSIFTYDMDKSWDTKQEFEVEDITKAIKQTNPEIISYNTCGDYNMSKNLGRVTMYITDHREYGTVVKIMVTTPTNCR